MNRIKSVFLTSFTAALMLVVSQPALAGVDREKIEFISYNPDGYDALISGDYKKRDDDIHGYLHLASAVGPQPAVIMMHGSGGIKDRLNWYKDLFQAFNDKGIAVFTVDSFTGRNIGSTARDQSKLSLAGSVVDAFQALKTLAADPRIDKNKIAIMGYSRGATVALYAVHEGIAKGVGGGNRFAAHLPIYPACQAQWQDIRSTGAPVLMLLGGKDNYTPAKFCTDYADAWTGQGHNVTYKVYPEANHGFDLPWKPKKCSKCAVFTKCGVASIDPSGVTTALEGKISTADGWVSYLTKLYKKCAKLGATVGRNDEARADSIVSAVDFFSEAFVTTKQASSP